MNSKLVGCMFFSVLVGGVCAGAAIASGAGVLAGLGIYSLAGSVTLVPSALLVASEPGRKPARIAAKHGIAAA